MSKHAHAIQFIFVKLNMFTEYRRNFEFSTLCICTFGSINLPFVDI